jgi:spoIIIJ-associated protein
MIRITADSLEEAYTKASKELNLSIIDLELEILQAPSKGILGLFKKPAIITATEKSTSGKNKNLTSDNSDIYDTIKSGIDELINNLCYDIELSNLSIENDTVNITLDGNDAALMIGKEGYRYKAISYMLHNWIKIKYDKNISLEIAEFLKNQENMIEDYLKDVKTKIDELGRAQTKPLDGILVKIALEKLREAYPDKYVAIRSLKDGRKKIIVNEYRKDQ